MTEAIGISGELKTMHCTRGHEWKQGVAHNLSIQIKDSAAGVSLESPLLCMRCLIELAQAYLGAVKEGPCPPLTLTAGYGGRGKLGDVGASRSFAVADLVPTATVVVDEKTGAVRQP